MKTSVIEVHDMLSVLSVDELEKRLDDVPGVESATVNFAAGSATVRYDETRLGFADIKSAVRQRGYEAAVPAAPSGPADGTSAHQTAPGGAPPIPAAPTTGPIAPATVTQASTGTEQEARPTPPASSAPATVPTTLASASASQTLPATTASAMPSAPAPGSASGDKPVMSRGMAKEMGPGSKDLPATARDTNAVENEDKAPPPAPDPHAHMAADFRKRFLISLAVTLPILALSPMLQSLVGLREAIRFPGDVYVLFGLSSAVFWYGGWPFLKGFVEEIRAHQPGMKVLISVAIATAYIYSSAVVFGLAGKMFFWELASLVDIMLLGHWIEMKSVMGASHALEALAQLMPSDAHKLMPDGTVKDVPLGELSVDDKVLIKPGEKIPADGVVVDGESSVDEAMLTGESTPVAKTTGGKVIGGAINGEGSLTIEVKGTGKNSFLSQVIDLVKQAQQSKSKTQDLANSAAMWLTFVALGGGILTFLIWQFVMGKNFAFAIE
ncbi:MAG: cation transporter, partial [Kofleriaceae bacterium]